MKSHYALAVDSLNVGKGDIPGEVFCRRRRGYIGIGRKLGNVGGVFRVDHDVSCVDAQDRGWRDLREAQLRARGGAESRSESRFPMPH
jgi:hypothetical protein